MPLYPPVTSGGSTSPGGSDTYVQFNDGGIFGGDAGLTYTKANDTLNITGSADSQRLILKANGTQTSNLIELKSSAGTLIGSTSGTGDVTVGKVNTAGVNSILTVAGYNAFGENYTAHGGWSDFQWRYSYTGDVTFGNSGSVVTSTNLTYNRALVSFNYDYSTFRGGFQISPTNFSTRAAIVMTSVNESHPYGDFRFRVLYDWTVPSYYDWVLKRDGSMTTPGKVGVNVTPTAMLHLPAGAAAANSAPLKFTSGTNLTTAVAGNMEYNNLLYFTESDATRRAVVQAASSTKTTASAPYTNDGYVTMRVDGVDIKVMTTA